MAAPSMDTGAVVNAEIGSSLSGRNAAGCDFVPAHAVVRITKQVKRNANHFPVDVMLQLTPEELPNLKSQFTTSSWGGRHKLPFAYAERRAIMAAGQPI